MTATILRTAHAQDAAPAQAPELRSESAPEAGARSEPPEAAVAHYQKGRELYLAGRYREAVVELELASTLDPGSANLIYNLARVYELLGEIDLSIHNYKRYRDLLPASETEEIARVTGTLQRLEGARDAVVDAPILPPVNQPAKRERGVADATFWTFAAGAVAAFAGGAALGALALGAERDVEHFVITEDDSAKERQDQVDYADRLALASDICLLSGAVLGTTAILLYALREKPAKRAPRAKIEFGAGTKGAFLVIQGRL